MQYVEHRPHDALRPLVECLWTLTAGPGSHRVLPDGCMDVLFDLTAGSAAIVGVMTKAMITPDVPSACLLGVRFRPGAAFSLLGIAAREPRDTVIALADLWKDEGRVLSELLAETADVATRLRLVEGALLERLPTARPLDDRVTRAVERFREARGGVTVAKLARRIGVGERQLERLFDERVGLGPKAFARVVRMQAARTRLVSQAPLAAVAAEHGYADEAHMSREFQALVGLTPACYARGLRMSDSFNPPQGPTPTLLARGGSP